MKTHKITSFVAALAASVTIQSGAATLEQALTFDLSGNAAGKTTTFGDVKEIPDVGVRITTKDIISLLSTNSSFNLGNASLLILSQFGPGVVATNSTTVLDTNVVGVVVTNGITVMTNFTVHVTTNIVTTVVTNREAVKVVIREMKKGKTNDTDVTSDFKFETLTNAPITRTGRFDTNTGVNLGSRTFELARIIIQNGTNAPLLEVRGYKTINARATTVKVNHEPVTGVTRSWDLDSATGVGRSDLGEVSLYGGAAATAIGVVP